MSCTKIKTNLYIDPVIQNTHPYGVRRELKNVLMADLTMALVLVSGLFSHKIKLSLGEISISYVRASPEELGITASSLSFTTYSFCYPLLTPQFVQNLLISGRRHFVLHSWCSERNSSHSMNP